MTKLTLKNPDLPSYSMTLPVSKKTAKFRPFVVREEKVLLIALQTQNEQTICDAMNTILMSCTNGELDTKKMCYADTEYAFLQLRAKSVGEEAKPQVQCKNCGSENSLKIRVDQFTVNKTEKLPDNNIKIYDDIVLIMQHPTIHDRDTGEDKVDAMFEMAKRCVDGVIMNDELFKREDIDPKELSEFIDNLMPSEFEKILKFFEQTPQINYDVSYTCPSCKTKVKVRFKSIVDFF